MELDPDKWGQIELKEEEKFYSCKLFSALELMRMEFLTLNIL